MQHYRESYTGLAEVPRNGNIQRLTNGLGWIRIGLGLAQIAAPSSVARLVGVDGGARTRRIVRLYGVRELAAGVGILSSPRASGWLWSSVAGDVIDLASLGSALNSTSFNKARTTAATAAVAGVTALDVYCGQQMARNSAASTSGKVHTIKAVLINRSPEDVYGFWRNVENFPTFIRRIESVKKTDDRRSHWKARISGDRIIEWDAEILEDRPERISWRSLPGSDVHNQGTVQFQRGPGGRGTRVLLELDYTPLGGILSAGLAKLFHAEPGQQAEQALRSAKQVLETGEVTRSDASIFAGKHAARPPAPEEFQTVHA